MTQIFPKVLAIDYGTTRIGLAINQMGLAVPLSIMDNDELVLEKIKNLVKIHQIKYLIFGLSENKMAIKTQFFATNLTKIIPLPFEFVDETLSSKEVYQHLTHSHMKKNKRQQAIDHFSAAYLLQEWLECYTNDHEI